MIRPETIEKVLETARIEEVIGDFLTLKKRGSNFIGNCPFHNEKTPSFSVSASKGIFKCFGCGKSGNVFGFVMEHEHLTYPDAVKFVAAKYKIEIEEQIPTEEESAAIDARESLFAVTSFATKWFEDQLWNTDEGRAIGLSYFNDREFRPETIKKFNLGFSPDRRDAFSKHAINNGYKLEFLESSGLSVVREDRYFDRFKGRVIFPIHNVSGRIVGFGARILTSDKTIAKYLNSPESEIYHKSRILYGLYQSRKAIGDADNCLLVEGYTDVISLHQAGIQNVVASSGTSLTTEQIRLIKRFTLNITILYDGDPAGIKASFRGIDMILSEGMNVRILLFPDNDDPDSFARKHHPDEVVTFIKQNSRDFINFKTTLLLEDAKGDPIKRAGLIREILTSIALVPDTIIRTEYIRECSVLMDFDEAVLFRELSKLLKQKLAKIDQREEEQPEAIDSLTIPEKSKIDNQPIVDRLAEHEKNIIRILILYGNLLVQSDYEIDANNNPIRIPAAKEIINDLTSEDYVFKVSLYQNIYTLIKNALEEGNLILSESHFVNHQDPEINSLAAEFVGNFYEISPLWESEKGIYTSREYDDPNKLVHPSLLKLRLRKFQEGRDDHLKQLEEEKDNVNQEIILNQLSKYTQAIDELKQMLGLSDQ
ncbi:MAG: DNA primase [Sphingobacteriia bacterium]|nr:DNA primase [Sphingobacteriia bacterium]